MVETPEHVCSLLVLELLLAVAYILSVSQILLAPFILSLFLFLSRDHNTQVIGNSQLYGGVFKLTAHATVNDGLLDVCVIKGQGMLSAPQRLVSIFARHYNRDSQVKYYQARQIEIRAQRGKILPVQVDGDYLGNTPMNFRVVPDMLWILVPPKADRSLWQS